MRLALDPRARRLLRRVPRNTVYTALELALLSLLALQAARLVWTVATPVGPVGDWQARGGLAPTPQPTALLGEFDPFFRLSGTAEPMVVTSLNLQLFGVRENRATGRGSAIIGTPEGAQRSFAVGEEIVPGVTLSAVGFDNVTISRNGVPEQLFLDQSAPATTVSPSVLADTGGASAPAGPSIVAAPPPPPPAARTGSLTSDVSFQPRMNGSEVTGVTVQPQGSGAAFRAAGLAPGDVILSVGGRRITSAQDARSIAGRMVGDREVPVQIERDGRVMTLRVRPDQ